MDSGLYAAYTGVLARTQALDTAANNLANANTNGFRAQREYFRGVLAAVSPEATGESQADTIENAVNSFGILGGSSLDLSQGLLQPTGNPLDLGLKGQGFFQIRTNHGVRLTRDGAFQRSSDGTLTTQHGEAVLNDKGAPITVPTGSVHVSADGTVSVDSGGGSAIAGRLGLVNYAGKDLQAEGTNHFTLAVGAKPIANAATVEEGSLEGANQDAVHGTMQLLLVQRQAEMMQKALSVFSNDFDKTASEELGRV